MTLKWNYENVLDELGGLNQNCNLLVLRYLKGYQTMVSCNSYQFRVVLRPNNKMAHINLVIMITVIGLIYLTKLSGK